MMKCRLMTIETHTQTENETTSSFQKGYFNVVAGMACILISIINIVQDKAPEWMVLGVLAGLFSILAAPVIRRAIAQQLRVIANWLNC